ncbi:MAG TPA: hypothetical protein VND70_03065 [Acidimicrobiales bacterium]|nr:hypothetical protein [Acidimicrobiales bacterium]
MSTAGAVALTLVVLALAGCLPTVALVGGRLVALPLCPLSGAVLCALAAASSIAVSGTMVMWLVLWASAAAILSAAALWRRAGPGAQIGRDLRREGRPAVLLGGAAVAAAVAWALETVRVASTGFDTRAIWLLHARWLERGHSVALAALRNHFDVVSHPSYPPLVSAVMALSWRVSGSGADRVAVVTVAALNACVLFVAGWGIVEVARRAATRLKASAVSERRLLALGVLLAALVVLVAGGVLGAFGTNGYADPLWSLAAVAGVVYGLVLTPSTSDLGVVAIVVGVAGLSKVEGTAMAIVLVLAVLLRVLLERGRAGTVRLPLTAAGLGLIALLGWPLLVVLIGVPTDASIAGTRQGSLWVRAQATFHAAVPHLHVVALAAVIAVAGLCFMRPWRGRLGLGNDLWAWGVLSVAVLVLGGAYVFGPGNIELWLATSVDRTTIFVALTGWWIVTSWALCGLAGILP